MINRFIHILILFICVNSLQAQVLPFHHYTTEHGLPQSQITALLQDQRGYLWIGTRAGLCRYDGQNFIEIPVSNNDIRCLYEDDNGKLWVGTNGGGLFCLTDSTYFSGQQANGLDYVFAIKQDANQNYWLATNGGGLCRMRRQGESWQFVNYSVDKGLLSEYLRTLIISADNSIWCGTPKGISRVFIEEADRISVVNYTLKPAGDAEDVFTICQTQTGQIWCGTNRGLYFSNPPDSILLNFRQLTSHSSFPIHSIYETKDGTIWIGSFEQGLFRLNWDSTRHNFDCQQMTIHNGLSSNYIQTIYEDREFNLWIGTWGNGISKLIKGGFIKYNRHNGLAGENIYAIFQDQKGELWFGSNGHGISILGKNGFHYLNRKNGLINDKIWKIIQDRQNYIWIASSGGVTRYSPQQNQFLHFTASNCLPSNGVITLCEDCFGRIWLGTARSGVVVLDSDKSRQPLRQFSIENGITNNSINALYEASDSTIWCGTETGFCKIKNNRDLANSAWEIVPLLGTTSIWSFYEDRHHCLWIGTNNYGLLRLAPDHSRRYFTEKEGLGDNTVYFIQPDDKENLWIGTNNGIDRLRFENDQLVQIKHFGMPDGLANKETNANSCLLDNAGNLWFGTIAGISCIKSNTAYVNPIPPPIHIEKIQVATRSLENPVIARLNHTESLLHFHYRGISLRQESAVTYQYQLVGADKTWQPRTSLNQVQYANLAPGSYRFQVKAANSDGIWSPQPASVDIIIFHPWWATWWCRTLAFIGLLALVYGVYQWRVKDIKKLTQLLERKVSERTLKLEQMLKKQQELEFQLFQSTKMAALGQLSASITHEINNPVAYVSNNMFLIKKNLEHIITTLNLLNQLILSKTDSSNTHTFIQRLEKHSQEVDLTSRVQLIQDAIERNNVGLERIQGIIGSLKNFTRFDKSELKWEDPHNCIEAALQILEPQYRGGIKIIKAYGKLEKIRCFADLLSQVFINLINNAIQSIEKNGHIIIRTCQEHNKIIIEIEDNGNGIPHQILHKIFDPFFTTKAAGQGMGLGLGICQRIIEKHHGSIQVKSTEGRGSIFRITLPVQNTEEVA